MILIVEDEAVSRKALATLLSFSGYTTRAVESAEEALQMISDGQVPQVALIDIELPGMNGLDLARRLQQSNPQLQSVIITASARDKIDTLDKMPSVTYLRKPLDFDLLLTILSRAQLMH